MARNATLDVSDGGVLQTLNTFWRNLLEKGLVDALLVPLQLPSNRNVAQTLVSDIERLEAANPLAPVLPVNSARIISAMTRVAPSLKKIGVVLRPCELRALIELIKLKQASLENLVLIGIDCLGTYSVNELTQETPSVTEEFLTRVKQGKDDPLLREACRVCEYPVCLNADLNIGLIGMDFEKSILLQAETQEGERILAALGLEDISKADEREKAISEIISQRRRNRDEMFAQIQKEAYGLDNLLSILSSCINCHNCKTACPLCYCKECLFDSSAFEWEAEKYLGWAERRGALRMPTDTLLFHLTRLNHVVTSCVGCGLCTEACPNNVPISNIFRLVGSEVQKIFDYVPGRNLDEQLPLITFKEDELLEVGR